jgi:calcium-dependent protein kinase
MKVKDITLIKCIGKGSKSEVYLASKGDDLKNYAVKRYERHMIENTDFLLRLKNEIFILQLLNHPNIIKFHGVTKTTKHIYCIFDYYYGDNLLTLFEKYQEKHRKPFSQEIIQHLMKQIVEGIKYLHGSNIVHDDIKLDSILICFEKESDKNALNMMKGNVKINHFKFADTFNHIFKKAVDTKAGKHSKYSEKDKKIDILDIGKMCYKMLFGKNIFYNEDVEKIFDKAEEGKCNYPITLSKEIISFLKSMLAPQPSERLKIEDLSKHDFLTKNVKNFQLIEQKEINELEQSVKIKGNEKFCMICFTNHPEIIICPCGHKCICILCYDKLLAKANFNKCPICKNKIESIVKKVIEV